MKLNANISRKLYGAKFFFKKNSPQILLGLGLIGTGVGVYKACKATLKLEEIGERKAQLLDAIDVVEKQEREDYTHEDAENDRKNVQLQTVGAVIKNYAPAAAILTASTVSILVGFNVLRKRNLALAAAYTALDKSYKSYRKRVEEKYGVEAERELYHGITVQEKIETNEDGEEVRSSDIIWNGEVYSPYAKLFDNANPNWDKDFRSNMMYLRSVQQHCNDLLISKGYLFLNDVYKLLNMEQTIEGQVVGWLYDPDRNPGDNYVDLGFTNMEHENIRRFFNGETYTIMLDFNVDGYILEDMENYKVQ